MEVPGEAPSRQRQGSQRSDLIRPILTFMLGVVAGAIAVVMFQTLDPDGSGPPPPPSGGGNARFSLDSDAIRSLVADKLGTEFGTVLISVEVEDRGVFTISMSSAEAPADLDGNVVIDPNIDGETGDIVLAIVEQTGIFPADMVPALQRALQDRLVALAGGKPYRVTAITTTGNRLGLEILS